MTLRIHQRHDACRRRLYAGPLEIRLIVGLLVTMLWIGAAAAQTPMRWTTLREPLQIGDTTATVASSAGALPRGVAVNTVLYIDREAMAVVAVWGNQITVQRGAMGTEQAAHATGSVVWVGPPDAYANTAPAGPCTPASIPYLPRVVVPTGDIYDCTQGTWARRPAAPTWGAIAGDLANQADLQAALNERVRKGASFGGGAAVINPSGELVAAGGAPGDCVRADGTAGPCGGGSGGELEAGIGIALSGATVAIEDAVIPMYFTGQGYPPPALPCQDGRDYYVDITDMDLYFCAGANWRAAAKRSHTHLASDVFPAQTSNTVFAGPASGGAASPGFRGLVQDDLPADLIRRTTVSISQSQILNLYSAPVTLIAAPGANRTIAPRLFLVEYSYGTTAYANVSQPAITYGGSQAATAASLLCIPPGTNILTRTSNSLCQIFGGGTGSAAAADYVNKALTLQSGISNPTGGDGTLRITIWYAVADTNF